MMLQPIIKYTYSHVHITVHTVFDLYWLKETCVVSELLNITTKLCRRDIHMCIQGGIQVFHSLPLPLEYKMKHLVMQIFMKESVTLKI